MSRRLSDGRLGDLRRKPRGFTLIEMVVALFLLALMSLIVYESYRAGLAMWERQHRDGGTLDSARVLVERLRSQLKSAYPWHFRSQTRQVLYFRGRNDSLEFASFVGLSSRRENGVLHLVRLSLEEGSDEGRRLRIEEYPFPRRDFPQGGDDALVSETVAGIEEFELRYQVETRRTQTVRAGRGGVPQEEKSTEKKWTDSWPDESGQKKNETVTAVSVSIKVKTGDGAEEEFTVTVPFMKSWLDSPAEGGA